MLIIGKKLSPYALLSISGLLAASDQAVKWLVQQSMAYGEYVSVTPFFNWVHLWNTGAAFSLFANGGGWSDVEQEPLGSVIGALRHLYPHVGDRLFDFI